MEDLTMGQRIGEYRKKLGLSQEAFGEKMGVSRQAISKWEADAAVPEIDKLIAMSRLFGVSVGWLLGVEKEPQTQDPDPGFTEEQLKIVEGIAGRYAKPQKRDRTLAAVIGCCAMVMLLAAAVAAITYATYVNQEMSSLYGMYNTLSARYWNIDEQFAQLSNKLDALAAGEQLLTEYTLEAGAWEDMTGATVTFTAIPKTTQAGDQAWLSVRLNGVEAASAMCTMDGSAYTATVDLPAANGYSYYFQVVHTGGGSSQQILKEVDASCVDLETALQGRIYVDIESYGLDFTDPAGTRFHCRMNMERGMPEFTSETVTVDWTRMELVLTYNGVEIGRQDILEHFGEETQVGDNGIVIERDPDQCTFSVSFQIPEQAEGDVLVLSFEADYSNGTSMDRPVAEWTVAEDGSMNWAMLAE